MYTFIGKEIPRNAIQDKSMIEERVAMSVVVVLDEGVAHVNYE